MRNHFGRRKSLLRPLAAAFLLATLAEGSLHHHEDHSPHSNRREMIEESRRRYVESHFSKNAQRTINFRPS